MKNLDEMRALAERAAIYGLTNYETHELSNAVLAMLPIVAAASKQADGLTKSHRASMKDAIDMGWSEEGRNWFAATDLTEQAVRAFRKSNA